MLAFASIGVVFAVASPHISLADRGAIGIGFGALALLLIVALVPFARNTRWLSRFLAWLARRLPGRHRILRASQHVAEMEGEIHRALTRYRGYTLLAFAFQLVAVFLTYIRPQIFFYFTQRALFTFPQLCLLYTFPIPRDLSTSRMPSSA